MAPTLEELLSPFVLPNDVDPLFRGVTVQGDVAPCGREDDTQRRILVDPNSPHVYFPNPEDVAAATTFLNPDDGLFRRILTGSGGFVYQRELSGQGGKKIPAGLGILHLCRKDAPAGGTSELYVSDNSIVNNQPGNTVALRKVPFNFRFSEIRAIVEGLHREDGSRFRLSSDHYQVDPQDHSQLSLFPDPTVMKDIAAMVQLSDSPIPAGRRKEIAEALNKMMERENSDVDFRQKTMDAQDKMRSDMLFQVIGSTVIGAGVGLYGILLASGKAGPINTAVSLPFRGLYNLLRAPFDKGEGLERMWRDITTPLRYRGIGTLLGIGTNMTEQARLGEFRPVADPTTPEVAKQIENTINSKHNTMSVLVEGPPGWGKEQTMRTLALRNPNTVYIQVTPNGMMGGTMYRGQLEQRLTDIPKEIKNARKEGRQVVLFVDEFHEALSAGKSQESSVSLLEHWKGELARGDLRIVGFSTPRELLKARFIAGVYNDPATRARLSPEFQEEVARFERDGVRQNLELRPLLNRFQPVILPPRPQSDIEVILKDKIAERAEGSGFKIEMEPGALERIAELSKSPVASEGYIPRTGLALFNGVIDANTAEGKTSVTVTAEMVDGYVKENYPEIAQRFSLGAPEGAVVPEFLARPAASEITPERKEKALEALSREVPGWHVFNTAKQERVLEKFWEFHEAIEGRTKKTLSFDVTIASFQKHPSYRDAVSDVNPAATPVVVTTDAKEDAEPPAEKKEKDKAELTREQVEDILKKDAEFRDLPPDEKKNRVDQVMDAWKGATPETRDFFRGADGALSRSDIESFSKRALERGRGLGKSVEVRPDDKRETKENKKERAK